MKKNYIEKALEQMKGASEMRSWTVLIFFYICFLPVISRAFNDETTHPELSERAIVHSVMEEYLEQEIGIVDNIDERINGKTIEGWIKYGSEMEDDPPCRASNHFHNPNLPWSESGLSDHLWAVDVFCVFGDYMPSFLTSNVTWATGYLSRGGQDKDDKIIIENKWDWQNAREYFYIYLTGKDLEDNYVAHTNENRQQALAKSMQALGQVVHLLQDVAAPAHVRDDFSQGHTTFSPSGLSPKKWVCNRFEKYVKKNNTQEWFDQIDKGGLASPVLSDFWDTDSSAGIDTSISSDQLGLAEYTHINFLSEYRMFTEEFPYPKAEHCQIWSYPAFEFFPFYKRKYVSSTSNHPGEQVNHLALVSHFFAPIENYFPDENGLDWLPVMLDNKCFDEYASKLIPRAIGYSSDLIDYFFRGKLQVSYSVPLLTNQTFKRFKIKVKNIAESQENMSDGIFTLIVRYTPWDGKPDGSDDEFVRSFIVPVQNLEYDQEFEREFNLYESIPVQYLETAKCMLAYIGKLGNEENAVIGKHFLPGDIKFLEAWDNDLNGKYPWYHSTDAQNYNNGSTLNVVKDGRLEKDNIRIINDDKVRINESFINFRAFNSPYEWIDIDSPDGIPVTPNTHLQFKIDDLSINQVPPAPEGQLRAYQHLGLAFNTFMHGQVMVDYLELRFTLDDHTVNKPNIQEVAYKFPPGSSYSVNIYDAFQSQGITIPEPFYLQRIELCQELLDLENPSTIEHHQHMEVDFISIIERYAEQE